MVGEEVENNLQIKSLYSKMSNAFTKREKEILEMRYDIVDGDVKTQREIALILGISRFYVSRIEKKL